MRPNRHTIRRRRRAAALLAIAIAVAAAPGARGAEQIDLARALEIAMSNSPTIRRQQNALERSQENLNRQRARLRTSFSLSVTPIDYSERTNFNELFSTFYDTRTTTSSGTFTISQPIKLTDGTLYLADNLSYRDSYSGFTDETDISYSNSLSLNYRQPLFTYNATRMDTRRLELALENTELSYAIAVLQLESNVMNDFYGVYKAGEELAIQEEQLAAKEESYGIARQKADAGLMALEALYQEEVGLAQTRSSIETSRVTYQSRLDGFKRLIGLPIDEEIEIAADIGYEPVSVDYEQALSYGLSHRMELRQRAIALQSAMDDVVQAGADNEFEGALELSYGTFGTSGKLADVYDEPEKDRGFAITFEIPIWDWGAKKSGIRAAETSLRDAEIDLEELKTDIVIDIRSAWRNVEAAARQIELKKIEVRNARFTYDIALENYRNGDISSYDLSQQQTQFTQARLDETQALIDYRLALLEMKITSLWDFEKERPAVDARALR
ncbi:MAG: TolC family protein [Candidatus Krumholzibacteriota bacterium]|nr:TolC family protein [Candidatus Krumholzibacteriota bacterium]